LPPWSSYGSRVSRVYGSAGSKVRDLIAQTKIVIFAVFCDSLLYGYQTQCTFRSSLVSYQVGHNHHRQMPQNNDGFQPMEFEPLNDTRPSTGRRRTAGRTDLSTTTLVTRIVIGAVGVVAVVAVAAAVGIRVVSLVSSTGNDTSVWYRGNSPPMAFREEDRIVQLGVAPPDWDPDLPRQSQESTSSLLDPPVRLPDPYGWLRDDDRENSMVLDYLYAENNYTSQRLNHLTPLADELSKELLHYMEETSHSFPILDRSYFYYRRTIEGRPYPEHCRAPRPTCSKDNDDDGDDDTVDVAEYLQKHLSAWDGTPDTPILPEEVVYLDENDLALGFAFFASGDLVVSPSETLMAYTVDTTGNELYYLRIAEISTGRTVFQDETLVLSADLEWGLDDDTLFYSKPDDTQRTYQVYKYTISLRAEELLYEELDVTYWVGFGVTQDKNYLVVEAGSSESSEVYYASLENVRKSTLKSISKRRQQVLYSVEHYEGNWWILSNLNDSDGDLKLWTLPVGQESDNRWTLVPDPSSEFTWLDKIAIENLGVFKNHIVLEGRYEGTKDIWILTMDPGDASKISTIDRVEFKLEQAHTAELASNLEYDTSEIVINFVSMVTPAQQIQIDMLHPNSEDRMVLYEKRVPGYQKALYRCTQIQVPSRDGKTQIPVSLVYQQSTWEKLKERGELVPIHLYAYGAYGSSMDDTFSTTRLPLLDRGMIFAVAHVRGGGEMGRKWYTDGKLLKKHNTFDDFVDVGRYFVDEQWTTTDTLSCEGRSAGGLTMGASLNQAPELFRAAILGVPFVDLVVTMSDASIPLVSRSVVF
jgi:oligopeptidase B